MNIWEITLVSWTPRQYWKPNTEIEAVEGTHLEGKCNEDVTWIQFLNLNIKYFPRGLGKLFPNLRIFEITSCDLTEIKRDDLVGVEHLEEFIVSSNQLTSLPSDLFFGMQKLKIITFRNNKLESIGSNILEPLIKNDLTDIDFRGNVKINAHCCSDSQDSVSIEELLKIIDGLASPTEENPNKITS